jgi:glyoxylase-like metal-dependent hydrolase (beta-lactamase superfamily II)
MPEDRRVPHDLTGTTAPVDAGEPRGLDEVSRLRPLTELDLQALGIWWIPLARPAARYDANANVWAVEDGEFGLTLFGCGSSSPASLVALSNGLAEAGATIRDVGRVILSHADHERSDGLRWIVQSAARPIVVVASRPVLGHLALPTVTWHVLRDGDRFQYRCLSAIALVCPGFSPSRTCFYDEQRGLLLSSDLLLDDGGTHARLCCESNLDVEAYRASLTRLSRLDISLVLPAHGSPFAGHRRVIRDALASLEHPPRDCVGPASGRPRRRTLRAAKTAAPPQGEASSGPTHLLTAHPTNDR